MVWMLSHIECQGCSNGSLKMSGRIAWQKDPARGACRLWTSMQFDDGNTQQVKPACALSFEPSRHNMAQSSWVATFEKWHKHGTKSMKRSFLHTCFQCTSNQMHSSIGPCIGTDSDCQLIQQWEPPTLKLVPSGFSRSANSGQGVCCRQGMWHIHWASREMLEWFILALK